MNEFGDFLYSLRKQKGLTQLELAKTLNVTNKAVSKWETGEAMPETSLLLPLSKILDVTVDELLQGKRFEENNSNNFTTLNNKSNQSENNQFNNQNNTNQFENDIKFNNHNSTNSSNNYNKPSFDVNKHLFSRGKDDEKTLLEVISGAVCATLFLLSITTYFLIGITLNLWSPYWVIIPVSALSCGIISLVFDLFNTKKKKQKLSQGENIYVGIVCGVVMLLCIISYLLLGAFLNLWHPYWFIIICGMASCGIVGSFGKVFTNKQNLNKDDIN